MRVGPQQLNRTTNRSRAGPMSWWLCTPKATPAQAPAPPARASQPLVELYLARPGVLRGDFREAAVGHRASVEVGAEPRHAAILQPPVPRLVGETAPGLLPPDQAAGAMDGRVEGGARLRRLDAAD